MGFKIVKPIGNEVTEEELTNIESETISTTGNVTVGGTLSATGNTTVGGTLSTTGNTTVGGTLSTTGNTTVGGTLSTTGNVVAEDVFIMLEGVSPWFVAVDGDSTIAATSPDGITWTQRTLPTSATWNPSPMPMAHL